MTGDGEAAKEREGQWRTSSWRNARVEGTERSGTRRAPTWCQQSKALVLMMFRQYLAIFGNNWQYLAIMAITRVASPGQ